MTQTIQHQEALQLGPAEVQVWRAPLSEQGTVTKRGRNLLSFDELRRADRFHSEQDRTRFVAAHSAMRQILSQYLPVSPESVVFDYGANGKPRLAEQFAKTGIKFNLAHSHELALVGISRDIDLGVDVEFINMSLAIDEMSPQVFSANELVTFRAIPVAQQVQYFFSWWSRKEAYVKALGVGLSMRLDQVEIVFDLSSRVGYARPKGSPVSQIWSVYDIDMGDGYKAALVIEGTGHELRYRQFCQVREACTSI